MYYRKLKEISERLNIPIQKEDIFITFSIQESRVRIEYLNDTFFDSIYSTDSDLEIVLDGIYNNATSRGFYSVQKGCTISLEGRKLFVFPSPNDFYESLNQDEMEDFFKGDINYNDNKFLVDEI